MVKTTADQVAREVEMVAAGHEAEYRGLVRWCVRELGIVACEHCQSCQAFALLWQVEAGPRGTGKVILGQLQALGCHADCAQPSWQRAVGEEELVAVEDGGAEDEIAGDESWKEVGIAGH